MKLKLIKKKSEASGTKTFFWQSDKKIEYLPGQYYYFTLSYLVSEDKRGPTRHFTLSSSPSEGNIITFTTRIRPESGYKQTLDKLPIGSQIEGAGPNGTFILDVNEPGSHILLAGGIGITPFRSFMKYNIDHGLKSTKLFLIYANSVPEEITFRDELELWNKEHENLKIVMTVSRPDESKEKWQGLTGRIDENLIVKLLKVWKLKKEDSTYWISGPPSMVEALEKTLLNMNISPKIIRSEKFTGY